MDFCRKPPARMSWVDEPESGCGTKIGVHDTEGAGLGVGTEATAAEQAWLSLSSRLMSQTPSAAQPVAEVPASAAAFVATIPPVPTATFPLALTPPPIPQRQHQRHPTPLSSSPSTPSLSPSLSLTTHSQVTPLSHTVPSSDVPLRPSSYSPSEVGQVPSSLSFITQNHRPGDFHIHYVNQLLHSGLRPHWDPPLLSTSWSTQYQQEEHLESFVSPRPLSQVSSTTSPQPRQLGKLFLGRTAATIRRFSRLSTSASTLTNFGVEDNLSSQHHEPNLTKKSSYPSNNNDIDEMGLLRAFTTSRRSATPQRSLTTLSKGRPHISLPTELISTTNMLSYTAPSIESMRAAAPPSSPTSVTSPTESNRVSFAASEEPSLTDDSSVSSVSSPGSPDSANRAEYFRTPEKLSLSIKTDSMISVVDMDNVSPTTLLPTPILPRRAPSHSKHEHVRLAHRRSQRVKSLGPLSTTSLLSSYSSEPSSAVSDVAEKHPFSQELEQLSEVVEELGALIEGEDERVMEMMGLRKWTPEEYIFDVASLNGEALFA